MKMQTGRKMRHWRRLARRYMADPILRLFVELAASFLGGFCLSAASLGNLPQPFCLGVLCAGLPGWMSMAFAIGGSLGYWGFWEQAGLQGIIWIAAGLPACVLLGKPRQKLLLPGLAAMIVALSGVVFQIWQGEQTAVAMYLLRVVLAFGTTCVVQMLQRQDPVAQYLAVGISVLALAQIAPVAFLNLGLVAAGLIVLTSPFPAVALTGLALDLAEITPVPMTAVLCVAYLLQLIPWLPRKAACLLPALVYLPIMGLCGQSQWLPVPALVLGGIGSWLVPSDQERIDERSVEGYVQTRLEKAAMVMAQAGQLLQGAVAYPVDEGAVLLRATERACGNCDHRKDCRAAERAKTLPHALLHQSSITMENVPNGCKKRGQMLMELQHSQEQYRLLLADRLRQQEYRSAVMQQYGFLAEYLQELSDELPHREEEPTPLFRPEVAVCSRGKEVANGDRCFWFAGTKGRYYLLLCDGMGTGEGAAYEARTAGSMLRRMLVAGYPASAALQSINSLCVLRHNAGAVTVDLAEVDLLTGRASLYKWGAAPSWLLGQGTPEKIGRECPPPGLSLEEDEQTVDRISLHNGAILVMISDGVDGAYAVEALDGEYDQPAGFLATLVLENGTAEVPDDATAAVLRLHRLEK